MAITNGTNITALEKPAVGVDTGPGWATALNNSIDAVDGHDHTTNKGSRITTAAININADLEFNEYQAKELKGLILSQSNASSDNSAIYSTSGNLYWRNSSGSAVQITDGSSVKGAAGTITGMGSDAGNQAGASYTHGSRAFNFFTDAGNSDFAKINFADVNLYKFSDDDSADSAYITILADSGISGAAGTITVPGETGTMLTSNSTVTDISVTSTTALKPILTLANNANDATSATINLKNLRGGSNAGVAGDDAGTINFYANDAANNNQIYSTILAEISDPTSGGEEGKISISVAEYDGTVTPGFILTGTAADGIIDATIGAGATSTTTIAGNLDVTDGTIVNVGDIDCDSISCADAANGLDINFNANTGTNKISLTDNLASALDITEAGNSYIKFVTTNSSEQIVIGKNSTFSGTTIADLGTVTTADINGGTIDGTAIATSTIATSTISTSDVDIGSGKTLDGAGTFDVSGGTLTTSLAQKQTISATAFASGTKMLFHQTAAPTGWTKETSYNDFALRLVSGAVGSHANVAFETAFTDHTISVHTLTTSEIPSHSHEIRYHNFREASSGNTYPMATSQSGAGGFDSGSTGGGGSHGHGNIDLDVSYVDVILATKD